MHYNEIRARMSALKDEEGGEKMAEDIFARMRREGLCCVKQKRRKIS